MINQDNTIYEIRYDFEAINNISFKPNSIVIFNGGSVNNKVSCPNYYGIINNKFVISNTDFIPLATSTSNGLMTSVDKINLAVLISKVNNLTAKGDTDSRPTLTTTDEGFEYYDITLKKKILWNGTAWVNLDGTELAQ